jgi:hypothetical protein
LGAVQDLLHSHISHTSRINAPIAVMQRRAGHGSPTITLGVYTTMAADEQREAVRQIAADLTPGRSGHAKARRTRRGAAMESGMDGVLGRDADDAADEKC